MKKFLLGVLVGIVLICACVTLRNSYKAETGSEGGSQDERQSGWFKDWTLVCAAHR
jgi:hypothetical protein